MRYAACEASSRIVSGTYDWNPELATSLKRYCPGGQEASVVTVSDGLQAVSTMFVPGDVVKPGWTEPGCSGDVHTRRPPAPP